MNIPSELSTSAWSHRLEAAIHAVHSAGAAVMKLRGVVDGGVEGQGGQLKTSADDAAEGWVLGLLGAIFPSDLFLSEEQYERSGVEWVGASSYWTVDALDGTRSFAEGYDGFCVQVAYIDGGVPCLGAIAEPVTGAVFAAAQGAGAFRLSDLDSIRLPAMAAETTLRSGLRFVDSTPPRGSVGQLFDELCGSFVESGSVGLKIVRLLDGAADIYTKPFEFKLWDVAPGEALLRELGGALVTWNGDPIDYAGSTVRYRNLLASSEGLIRPIVDRLSAYR